jgi:hypothetical protein
MGVRHAAARCNFVSLAMMRQFHPPVNALRIGLARRVRSGVP